MNLWLISTILVFTHQILLAYSEIDKDTADRIAICLDAVTEVTDLVKDHGDDLSQAKKVVSPMISRIGQVAPFLGAAGAFLSVVLDFLSKQDLEELKNIKDKFTEVEMKLDKLTTKFDGIENLITFEAQRAAYISAEQDVKFGYKKLVEFIKEIEVVECNDETDCKRKRTKVAEKYVEPLRKTESALNQILTNLYSSKSTCSIFIGKLIFLTSIGVKEGTL